MIHKNVPIWKLFGCRTFLGDYLEEGGESKETGICLLTWAMVPKKQRDR